MMRLILALGLALAPSVALACPGCVASPYGDRTFGWAYLILYAAPFFVASAIAGTLVYAYAFRSRRPAEDGARPPAAPYQETLALRPSHGPDKETT